MNTKKDASKKKTFPAGTQEDTLKDTNRKLRAKIRRLESDKQKLLSEAKQYKNVFNKSEDFLRNSTKEFSLEEILDRVKKNLPLHEKGGKKPESKIRCPDCGASIKPMEFNKFSIHACKCGYRKKIEK